MNKKIKIIELLNKKANGEGVPNKIKIDSKVYNFCDACKIYEDEYERDLVIKWNELNNEVEILEDNTEEIEELEYYYVGQEKSTNLTKIIDKIEELRVAVNKLRKEKE